MDCLLRPSLFDEALVSCAISDQSESATEREGECPTLYALCCMIRAACVAHPQNTRRPGRCAF